MVETAGETAGGGEKPLLVLRDVGKTFSNGVTALRNVDLTIGEGDFLSLLGPSGCGKSTALRIIAGLSTPTTGLLDWRGGNQGRSDIGFVFQEPTLLPWASVFDNVWLPLQAARHLAREGDAGDPRDDRPRASHRLRERHAARAFRRHEDARLDRARPRHQAAPAADGRAFRRARRDHPLQAQQRPARALAGRALHRRLRHPQRVRERVPLQPHRRHGGAAGPGLRARSRSTPPIRATRRSAPRPNMRRSAGETSDVLVGAINTLGRRLLDDGH